MKNYNVKIRNLQYLRFGFGIASIICCLALYLNSESMAKNMGKEATGAILLVFVLLWISGITAMFMIERKLSKANDRQTFAYIRMLAHGSLCKVVDDIESGELLRVFRTKKRLRFKKIFTSIVNEEPYISIDFRYLRQSMSVIFGPKDVQLITWKMSRQLCMAYTEAKSIEDLYQAVLKEII